MFRWYVINTYSGHENKVKANLEHRIDSMGQRTDQWSWQGNDGTTVTQTPSGTLTQTNQNGTVIQQSSNGVITQTNPDHSTVTYDLTKAQTT